MADCRKPSGTGESAEADVEFVVTEEGTEEDDEQTLEEEERMEGEADHKNEIDSLQKEGMNYSSVFLVKIHSEVKLASNLSTPGLPKFQTMVTKE